MTTNHYNICSAASYAATAATGLTLPTAIDTAATTLPTATIDTAVATPPAAIDATPTCPLLAVLPDKLDFPPLVTLTTYVPADAGEEEEDSDDEDVPPLKPRYEDGDSDDEEVPVPALEPYADSDDEDEDDEDIDEDIDEEEEVAVPHLPDSNTSVTSHNTVLHKATLMDELSVAAAHVANAAMTEGGRFA
jgi:hypothetical protein